MGANWNSSLEECLLLKTGGEIKERLEIHFLAGFLRAKA
jgi:hypothetical protein